ncbi:MAG: hypothetical protein DRP42_05715 [Tenericutes bacterium]|nr:MAG: hypothetical protein DRP42_05715 [Mycoplasmatota bacterium]
MSFDSKIEALAAEHGREAMWNFLESLPGGEALPNVVSMMYYIDDNGDWRKNGTGMGAQVANATFASLDNEDQLQVEKYLAFTKGQEDW